MKSIILASTSTVHGSDHLEYLLPSLEVFFREVEQICFIPYARPGGVSLDDYTKKVGDAFQKINKSVRGLHTFNNPLEGIQSAKGFFTGGGNTFVLLKSLYESGLMEALRGKICSGTPYLGTSAGSNICGQSIGTTNDMPIVYPPTHNGLGLVPFNINPHYLDPDPGSTHMGESRETRIEEFHVFNMTPVVGLREGSFLFVRDDKISLEGPHSARLFRAGQAPTEIEPGPFPDFSDPGSWNEI